MQLKSLKAGRALLRLSLDALGTMGNALNEVCNGIRVADFESKMGGRPEEVEQILDEIIPIYRKADKVRSPHVTVSFSSREVRSIIGALKTVCREIDEIEFYTRMGAEISEVEEMIDKLIPIYHKMKEMEASMPRPA